MTTLGNLINSIHVPTFVVVFLASLFAQFSLQMNGVPVDPSTNEGRANIIIAILLLLTKSIQASPITPAK